MKHLEYPLFAEGFINRFITTGVYTQVQQFEKATLSGRVNEWLKKGFAIHENPCRKEFIAKRRNELPPYIDVSNKLPGETVSVFGQEQALKIYFPFGNIGHEASGFYYRPTYLRSYSFAFVNAPVKESVDFEITTCGGMTIWLNDRLVTDYIPFTRNMVKHTTITMNMEKGPNKLVVCLDDLAERDTDYYFRIRYLGEQHLTVMLPLDEQADAAHIMQAEQALDHISFDQEAYFDEPVIMNFSNYGQKPLDFKLIIEPGEFIEKMQNQEKLVSSRNLTLSPGQTSIELLSSGELLPGYYYFTPHITIDGILLKRKIGTQLVRKDFLQYHEPDGKDRKQRALETIYQYGVNNVYRAAVCFKLNRDTDKAEQIILEEIDGVNQRKDCSDFHFTIIIYIYHTYYDKLSPKARKVIEDAMTGYRYWIDEPGDDVMWFFSENHALLFHICQYLAGKYLPDSTFTNSGMPGTEVCRKGEALLNEWFEGFFEEFITEWNSNAYIPVDVLGLGTLYNLTGDCPALHEKAKKALDMICYALAVNQHKGAIMTSFGRTYEKEMKGNYNAGTTALLYILYNAGYLNRGTNGYISIILGDYEAPQEYAKYLNLTEPVELIHQNTQGFEQHVNLYLYKNHQVLLSTAVGFKPYENGYQEHIVQAVIDETAQVFINHPGESHPYGSGRPNFWAGNGNLPLAVQYENVSILRYDIPEENRIDYTHAYVPISEFKKYIGSANAIALEKDGGYIGIRVMNELRMQQEGPCRHREFISTGRRNIWVLKVAVASEYEDVEDFLQALEQIEIQDTDDGCFLVKDGTRAYEITSKGTLLVNETVVHHYPLDVKGRIELREDETHGNTAEA